ncbi:MAG TPA: DUF2127 domain-containing protein [Solirubrobacteraceae bacterium]|nr:DUF2127 domain-containing protein [Solirubrobacteraceae bacterium]
MIIVIQSVFGKVRRGPASAQEDRRDRLLPWIAAERTIRAIVLIAAGVVLLSHPHADWAADISHLAQRLGLNPNDNWIKRAIDDVRRIHAHEDLVFGVLALAYGALEAVEAYGLFRRRRWGQWLTVVATSILIVPEVWELAKSASALKLGALALNVLVVCYLVWRARGARD